MFFVRSFWIVFFGLIGASTAASTVNFASVKSHASGQAVSFDQAVMLNTSGGSIVYMSKGETPGMCARDASGACAGDLEIVFVGPVSDLSFSFTGVSPTAPLLLTIYDEDGATQAISVSDSAEVLALSGQVSRASVSSFGGESYQLAALSFSTPTSAKSGRGASAAQTPQGNAPENTHVGVTPQIETDVSEAGYPADDLDDDMGDEYLDFTNIEYRDDVKSVLHLENAIVSRPDGGDFFVYGAGEYGMPDSGGFCALKEEDRATCKGDFLITFLETIVDLNFEAFFVAEGDAALVSVWSGDELIEQRVIDENGQVDFSGLGPITHIEVNDQTTGSRRGLAYGNFTYRISETQTVDVVPLPGSLSMLLGALGAITYLRRRANKLEQA